MGGGGGGSSLNWLLEKIGKLYLDKTTCIMYMTCRHAPIYVAFSYLPNLILKIKTEVYKMA